FQVVFARNHGLAPGARVRHRGIVTGEVRRVDLSSNGAGVVVEARIKRRYRSTLTDKARVWVARPSLSGSLVSGLSAEELDALFVPYLSYLAPDRDAGQPVVNGARIKGTEQRPDIAPVTPAVADATFGGANLPATRPGSAEERLVRVLF